MMTKSVLVTGMSGLVGTAFREQMGDEYNLSALNRREVPGVPVTRAELGNFDAIRPAFDGQDTVVHLAAKISDAAGWDALLETNVVGTRNVLEASREAGVRRVVFTSSGATVSGWEREEPYRAIVEGRYDDVGDIPLIDESMATRPANMYAATKVWGESIARYYSEAHNLEVICLRIGLANPQNRPESPRQFSVWNSHRDVVNAINLAINVDLPQLFETFFIISDNKWGYRNISKAKSLLGYLPADRAEDHR